MTHLAFSGATKEIRDAIASPSVENEARAWAALQPSVRQAERECCPLAKPELVDHS